MSRVLKSHAIQVGTPKAVIDNTPPIVRRHVEQARPEGEGQLEVQPTPEELTKEAERVANSIIEDAKQMYLKIIDEGNFEAKKILDSARAEAERFLEAEQERGFEEGYNAGFQESKKQAQAIIDEAAEIREYLDERKDALYKEVEGQVIDLVLDISRKVIGQEITQNREYIFSLVEQALHKCAFKEKLMIRVAPEEYEFIAANKNRISMMIEGISDLEVYSDLSLKPGGCVIETTSGDVNSSVEVQMRELEKIYLYMLRNE